MAVNIPKSNFDPFYRYRRPRIFIENRKGNTTAIVNIFEIGKSLNRDPQIFAKIFSKELGTRASWSSKEKIIVVNGKFTVDQLESVLEGYIENQIMCQECSNPETIISPDGTISCQACGHLRS
jgi:translation initiation factor 2 beta subunit (eIF-2beta)/eIF-5